MALKKITNISSGIYTREIDLTVQTEAAGTFAGGGVGIMEKGPAFEIITSSTFADRSLRLGGLNATKLTSGRLKYPSSYYARGFLNQASNYKEVRILGLEGYSDSASWDTNGSNKAAVIMFDIPGSPSTPATWPTVPVSATAESIIAVLKFRRESFTNLGAVDYVEVDPISGAATATDEFFLVTINFEDPVTYPAIEVSCSMRPGSADYIATVLGSDPRDGTLLQGNPSPLWVEFIIPSVTRRPDPDSVTAGQSPLDAAHPKGYYYPGNEATQTELNLTEGNITADITFTYPTKAITGASNTDPIVITAIAHTFVDSDKVDITGVLGNTAANDTFYVKKITDDTFELYTNIGLTTSVAGNGAYTTGGTAKLNYAPTWETEIIDFGDIPFQTPITSWFVSDFNLDGEVKRLFRIWSISDGEAGNSEIKVEVSNIDPTGNGGKGSFDVFVREFGDTEDFGTVSYEGFRGLTLDPLSDNYVLRKIGDGENFTIRSRYIFIEMNEEEPLPNDALPYGIEGYPGVAGISMPDIVWTTEYDLNKVISKQTLGLPNNNNNMFHKLALGQLAFKNVQTAAAAQGKGFHMNPQELVYTDTLYGVVSANYDLVDKTAYLDRNDDAVTASEKVRRSKYVTAFYGGFDGFNVYNPRQWDNPIKKDFEALALAVEVFNDKESLEADISVFVTPDINIDDHSAACEGVLEMCENREDCLYVYDFAYDDTANPGTAKDSLTFSEMKSNYGAVYFPWCQVEDDTNKVNVWLPPSLIALQTIASVATNEEVWQPPAGSLRTITADLLRTRRRMKLPDREILKSVNINPITLFPGSGFEITESRTTQEVFSALSFIHNRLLLGFAKKALNQSLRPILHQLQTDSLRRAFENIITPIFDRIQKLNGIETFEVTVLDVEEDRTTLNGQIVIVPLYPVERIIVDFVLKDSGVSFNE